MKTLQELNLYKLEEGAVVTITGGASTLQDNDYVLNSAKEELRLG